MSVSTRPARETDLDALVAIEKAAFAADRISSRSFRMLLTRSTAVILVGQHADRIVGYAALLFRKASTRARLYSIATLGGEKGAGRTLLGAAETAARSHGARSVYLEVREDNGRAIDLYEKSGYRRFGRRPDYYADGATALLLQKQLGRDVVDVKSRPPADGTAAS